MADSVPLDDPQELAAFGKLDVVARLIVEGYMMGQHKSPFKGSSVEFVEHRQYYPGDEIRHIDWRAFGKTGKYYIKEFEEETNLRAYLLMDCSGSMSYGESTISKFDYARQLTAAFGYLLNAQRDAVGLITFDTKIRERFDPSTNIKNYQQLTSSLSNTKPGGETSLGRLFEEIILTLKRRSLVVIMSDFFDDIEALKKAVQLFRRHRHEVLMFQVIAPEELEFPFTKPTQFRSLERDRQRILVDPHRLRKIYLEQFRAFQKQLTDLALQAGFDFQTLTTDQPYGKALGAYLASRSAKAHRASAHR